jgi:hypothetical protein
MFHRPMGRFLCGLDGYTAKCILLEVTAGLCAHKLPF